MNASTPSVQKCDVDKKALELSFIPGSGQLYKGHYLEAANLFAMDLLMLAWVVTLVSLSYAAGSFMEVAGLHPFRSKILLNPVTICAGAIPALLYWLWAIAEAYLEPDFRHQTRSIPDPAARRTTTVR